MVMRRRHGSTHRYAHSEDLEQEVRCSGATDHRSDRAAKRALQPPLQLIPSFRQPCTFSAHSDRPKTRQERQARVVRHAHSKSERVDAPQAWQHARICAEGRLRAQSLMWRSAGLTGRWRSNARGSATSATQPIQLPTHCDRSPPPTARIGPKLGRNIEHWWYDRSPANQSAVIPRSPAITQDIY